VADITETDLETGRLIAEDYGHPAMRDMARDAIAAALAEQRERDAVIAKRYGCGREGCTECHAGAAAASIRRGTPC
jgi:hypothetical protein